jgi:outer membrane receptor protein involved in Fe transport
VQLSAYQAHYRGVIGVAQEPASPGCPAPCFENENRDNVRVRGLEATARHKIGGLGLWANYTHTQAVQSVPLTGHLGLTEIVRVPNIAKNQVNVGVDAEWHRLTAAVRTHYSGPRKIGHGTAFITDPDYLGNSVDAYSTTAVSLMVRELLPNVSLQFLADNLFNKQYWVVASEEWPSVLQSGRTVNLRIIYRLK